MTGYTSSTKLFCSVFKSTRKSGMYVYVDRQTGVAALPEQLRLVFGEPVHVLDMVLTPTKKLAQVEARKVLEAIAESGFYLQLPTNEAPEVLGSTVVPRDSLHG